MVEELAHGDLVAVGQQPGQVAAHRVVEADPALGDQLEHDGGHEHLGLAGHPEGLDRAGRLAGAQVADPPDPPDGAAAVLHGADRPGRPGGHHGVQQPLEVGRAGGRRGRGGLGGAGQGQAGQQGEREQEAEAPAHAAVPFGGGRGAQRPTIPSILRRPRSDQPLARDIVSHAAAIRTPGAARRLGDEPGVAAVPGWWLAHADLHNHTRLSDGAGDPRLAFASMRAAGLDVAALTDHSRWASVFLDLSKAPGWTGIDGRAWRQTIALAEAANADGEFVALHGFEWSHAAQGHMNVWNSERFTDPLRTAPTMGRFWRWLEGPGDDGLAGFNHPGTGRLRFGGFGYRPAMARRLVSLELFNKLEDYLLKDTDRGLQSPLNQCLNAGWRVGLLGVTDEHGADWGQPEGKGRAGLWVRELTRAGVLEALAARRFFASRVKGLRVDAALTSLAGAGGAGGERAGPHGHRRRPPRRPGAGRGRPGPGRGLGGPAAGAPGAAARGAAAGPGRHPRGRPARPRRAGRLPRARPRPGRRRLGGGAGHRPGRAARPPGHRRLGPPGPGDRLRQPVLARPSG